jgi:hypothetical protein
MEDMNLQTMWLHPGISNRQSSYSWRHAQQSQDGTYNKENNLHRISSKPSTVDLTRIGLGLLGLLCWNGLFLHGSFVAPQSFRIRALLPNGSTMIGARIPVPIPWQLESQKSSFLAFWAATEMM